MSERYTEDEIRAAMTRLHPEKATGHLLRALKSARIDKRTNDALAEMRATSEALRSTTGAEWMALQERFTAAMAEMDKAMAESEALR